MKLSFVALLMLLSFLDICSSGQTSSSSSERQLEVKKSVRSGIRINLLDLNDDVLGVILDQMDFVSLVKVKPVHPHLAAVAKNALRQRYRDYTIAIYNPTSNESLYREFYRAKTILVLDFDLAVYLLKHHIGEDLETGHAVKIHTDSYNNITQSDIIHRLVNQYGAKSIKYLNVGSIYSGALVQYTVPFESVEEFSCTFRAVRNDNYILPFDLMFPKLKVLTFELVTYYRNVSFLDCKLPQLEYMHIFPKLIEWERDDPCIRGLIRNNPQIKELHLINFPPDYRNVLGKMRSNLEKLSILEIGMGNDTVCFENVKDFKYSPFEDSNFLEQSQFPSLETVQMTSSSINHNQWRIFLRKHQHLKKAFLEEYVTVDPPRFMELLDEMPNLDYLHLTCNDKLSVQTIATIIQHHRKLKAFDFVWTGMKSHGDEDEINAITQQFDSLREQFRNEWTIVDYSGKVFVAKFARKNI